jgi:heme oxygenase
MLVRLANETAPHHATADDTRLAAMNVASRNAYRAALRRIYGFESSVEHAMLRIRELDAAFIEERMRSRLLREDLRALGLSEVEIGSTAYSASPCIDSPAHAIGWLFVLERQMLVSGLIKRQIERVLGGRVHGATAYFSAYGDTPGATFRAFADGVSKLARRHPPNMIVAGAVEAFRAQRQWYGAEVATRASETKRHVAAPGAARALHANTAAVGSCAADPPARAQP